ncbi:hypothetical protein FALB51S_02789 [Frigidibacter albus]
MKKLMLATILAGAVALPALAADYTIIAPANPGGGWDQTARTMQAVLQDEKISSSVQVQNVPGAGGTIGLAQFASQNAGNANALIVGGYVMVGAILTNNAPVGLDAVTPIARLTGEYEAIVVPAASPIQTIEELVEALKADPGAVSLGRRFCRRHRPYRGGPAGQGGRRRSDQDQLHRLFGRRRGAGGHPRQPGHRRCLLAGGIRVPG